jgi:membrane-associated phospholipid phosphatase
VTRLATHNRHHDGYVSPINKADAITGEPQKFSQNRRFTAENALSHPAAVWTYLSVPLILFSYGLPAAHELGKNGACSPPHSPVQCAAKLPRLDSFPVPFDDPITRVSAPPENPSAAPPAQARPIPLDRLGWVLAIFVLALGLDVPISTWVHDSGLSGAMKNAHGAMYLFIRYGLRFYGIFWLSTIPAFLILLALRKNSAAMIVLLAGIFAGVNQALKWTFGRYRPFHGEPVYALHPFVGGLPGLLHAEVSLSFPSGDVTLAFAMTASLTWAAPRLKILWWCLGIWVCLERIAEGAHYPSDTVAGACLGWFVALAARRLVNLFSAPTRRANAP